MTSASPLWESSTILSNVSTTGDAMRFCLRLTPLVVVAILATASLSPASAASQCTAAQWRQFSSLMNQLNTNLYRFENARVKEICRAGRPLVATLRKASSWIQRNPQCTMATARDRRQARKMISVVSRATADFRRACGR
ncbi:hypothetical protein [Taklimakanibacter albus]|uniref:Uncharacterized protein n=1 Tax=Taklimakanibacter albus TaxID=2800327 RepID=A0ACC5QWP7_9HYPH|nr:hypothetical protein [Aestuariivirga sp. YIM B02566]MBK1864800.1 hypothetical protein [Aestuariivirga sp. YIM B02566]